MLVAWKIFYNLIKFNTSLGNNVYKMLSASFILLAAKSQIFYLKSDFLVLYYV